MKPIAFLLKTKNLGPVRESNPRPLAPEARVIPLDQRASIWTIEIKKLSEPNEQTIIE